MNDPALIKTRAEVDPKKAAVPGREQTQAAFSGGEAVRVEKEASCSSWWMVVAALGTRRKKKAPTGWNQLMEGPLPSCAWVASTLNVGVLTFARAYCQLLQEWNLNERERENREDLIRRRRGWLVEKKCLWGRFGRR
ncbi:hypothetical protein RUM44_005027 [Polyplax serrata]|uniref:Uncharacterized protein n=1 Tax=Polyplax serrata TaxID=468196 RepID=A0ABR1AWS9_POLSC